jgi:hypothetical protein
VVRHGDAAELRKGLVRLSNLTAEQREVMGKRAQQLVWDRYDVAQIGAQFLDVCCQAAGVNSQPDPSRIA